MPFLLFYSSASKYRGHVHIPHELSAGHRARHDLGHFFMENFNRGTLFGFTWAVQNAWNLLHYFNSVSRFRQKGKMIKDIYRMKAMSEHYRPLKEIEANALFGAHNPSEERHERGFLMPHEQIQAIIENREALVRIQKALKDGKKPLEVDTLLMRGVEEGHEQEWIHQKRQEITVLSELINNRANILSQMGSLESGLMKKGPSGIAKEAGEILKQSREFRSEASQSLNLLAALAQDYYNRWDYYNSKRANFANPIQPRREQPITERPT